MEEPSQLFLLLNQEGNVRYELSPSSRNADELERSAFRAVGVSFAGEQPDGWT